MKTVHLLCSYTKLYQQQRHLKAKQSPEKKKQQFEVRWSDSKPPSLQMNNLDNYLPWWNIFISAAIIFLLRWWEWGESAEEAGKTAITVSILLHNICFKKNEGNILGQVCNTRKESYCIQMAVSKNHLFKGVRSGILRRKESLPLSIQLVLFSTAFGKWHHLPECNIWTIQTTASKRTNHLLTDSKLNSKRQQPSQRDVISQT